MVVFIFNVCERSKKNANADIKFEQGLKTHQRYFVYFFTGIHIFVIISLTKPSEINHVIIAIVEQFSQKKGFVAISLVPLSFYAIYFYC